MAKKKKVKENNSTKNNLDLKQGIIATEGKVSISLLKGKIPFKKINIKNQGSLRLFQGIVNFLAGYYLSNESLVYQTNYLPRFLSIGTEEDININWNSTSPDLPGEVNLGSRIKLQPNVALDNDKGLAMINLIGVIPGTSLRSLTEGEKITYLGLFTKSTPGNSDLLAAIKLEEPIEVIPGMSLLINWQIVISNKQKD